MAVPAVIVMLGVCGLAIDLGLVYNRKAELHGLAKTVALAAARELNGTPAGITAALAKGGDAARRIKFKYGIAVPWTDDAIRFGSSPSADGGWVDAASARSSPAARFYVKVDTSVLGVDLGAIQATLMPILTGSDAPVVISEVAIAGRSAINVDPLAICAMSPLPGAARANTSSSDELVEYGFRRGVTYDLMQLNPNGIAPVHYVVDPVSPPGGLGAAGNTSAGTVSPFVCAGRMWIPRVTGGPIRVSSPFPIGSLYRQLNSRFDQYDGAVCDPGGAPPDFNVKAYTHDTGNGVTWMTPRPAMNSAAGHPSGNRLQTIVDPVSPPSGLDATMYGPLWAYARAVKFSGYTEGVPEPADGYPRFAPSDWPKLYASGPAATSFPSKTPYFSTFGNNYRAPSGEHLPTARINRRLLHVPLLSCPVAPGTNVGATAVAIGKFFMTSPATSSSVFAEFAGIAHESTIPGQVILYP
ncbi:pilus assembly protein TadE [Massilia sp. ST3]|uniref:pilus assembly protein TadE n=1 Tax=Massilia sp. ST3 TaxID=2824903 RepID=UPI001B837764|nr:pilus assembly protein TadE [Massilia sp. ST3]MBQ5947023.1 pilus assembly protein TadE [Massilia sp. ST3]